MPAELVRGAGLAVRRGGGERRAGRDQHPLHRRGGRPPAGRGATNGGRRRPRRPRPRPTRAAARRDRASRGARAPGRAGRRAVRRIGRHRGRDRPAATQRGRRARNRRTPRARGKIAPRPPRRGVHHLGVHRPAQACRAQRPGRAHPRRRGRGGDGHRRGRPRAVRAAAVGGLRIQPRAGDPGRRRGVRAAPGVRRRRRAR